MQALIDAFPALLVGVGLAFLFAFVLPSRRSIVLLTVASSAVLLAYVFLVWFFRDGMGPDAVESTGVEAAGRIGENILVPVAAWLALNALAFARYRAGRGRAA